MISEFDEYAVHQTSNPVNQPGPSDRNFYDRYWFNGFDREGAFVFEVGFGLYPNRFVQDAHFSVALAGAQHSFHGARRAPRERADSSVGPLRIEVLRPLRAVRVVLAPNDTGLECDLTFRALTAPTEEPKNVMREDGRLIMETSRYTQLGQWQGRFAVAGTRHEVRASSTPGTRDRSWGVRPVGEPEAGAPGLTHGEPGVYWVWAPLQFDDVCTQFGSFEDRDGCPTQLSACIVPRYASEDAVPRGGEPGLREMAEVRHRIRWERGTRRPAGAELHFVTREGEKLDFELERIARFQMQGIGYQHPEWGHGFWKGELATGGESWRLDELDPLDYKNVHVHTICRAHMSGPDREREGVGVLETICFGRHAPSGFRGILDGAP
jgi:hypothetical protein